MPTTTPTTNIHTNPSPMGGGREGASLNNIHTIPSPNGEGQGGVFEAQGGVLGASLVSIVLCTYNGGRFLREQLDSLLAQTYPFHELIIQDDGSTDDTWKIMEEYAARDSRIKIFHNEAEHGVNGNFFSAMARAEGDFIAICDQDDIWEPDKIERQVAAIGDNLITGGPTIPFSGDGSPVPPPETRKLNNHILRLMFVSMMPGHSMLVKSPTPALPRREGDYTAWYCFSSPTGGGREGALYYDTQLQIAAAAYERLNGEQLVHVRQRRYADAVTYTLPTDSRHTLMNTLRYVGYCLRIYRRTRPFVRRKMALITNLLNALPCDTESKRLALRMAELQTARGPLAYLRLTAFSYRNRKHLFHTVQTKDTITLKLRSLLFPVTSAYYFRTHK